MKYWIIAAALALAGPAVAGTPGDSGFASPERGFSRAEPAACQGWGRYCRPGFVRTCGPYRCWCRPCR